MKERLGLNQVCGWNADSLALQICASPMALKQVRYQIHELRPKKQGQIHCIARNPELPKILIPVHNLKSRTLTT